MRRVPAGEPYRLLIGEKVIGVDANCGGQIIKVRPGAPAIVDALQDELSKEVGPGFGDWIRSIAKPIATVMGKKGCTQCEARRIVTNAYGKLRAKHGQLKALALIKDMWSLSMTASGDEVLIKLKELLND